MKNVKWRSAEVHKKSVWNALDGKDTIVVFDTETTGLEEHAKIIQFSAIKFALDENKNMTELDTMDMYINPEEVISSQITEITGITNNMLRNQPSERQVYEKIFGFMKGADAWAGHNISFDVRKLEGMALRCKYDLKVPDIIDTLTMARNLMPKDDPKVLEAALAVREETHTTKPNHKLATVTKFLFPDYQAKYHNSLEDVRATAKCLGKMTKMYAEINSKEESQVKVKLKYAFFSINPYKRSDQRIKIVFDDTVNKTGRIYYDAMNQYWSCTSGPGDKEFFESVDKADLETKLLNRYHKKFGATCMEDLVRSMRADYMEKHGKEAAIGETKESVAAIKGETSLVSENPSTEKPVTVNPVAGNHLADKTTIESSVPEEEFGNPMDGIDLEDDDGIEIF